MTAATKTKQTILAWNGMCDNRPSPHKDITATEKIGQWVIRKFNENGSPIWRFRMEAPFNLARTIDNSPPSASWLYADRCNSQLQEVPYEA